MRRLTDAEVLFCQYQIGTLGDFFTCLIKAMLRADETNRKRLALGFPELMEVVIKYQEEDGYWQEVEQIWNERFPNHQII